ncbi:MAG: hypothetical protein U1F50_11925 [Rubrivivax sp.]
MDASVIAFGYLGAVGMPGVTAWLGLVNPSSPKPARPIVVSATRQHRGGVVGQLAKAPRLPPRWASPAVPKCRYVVEELGFDACVDYKQHRDAASLACRRWTAAPEGIDGNFKAWAAWCSTPMLDA